jgi:hypothetical protein
MERMRSPGRSTWAAGVPRSTEFTPMSVRVTPSAQKSPQRITKASTRLTAGPAAMTTIRFHTGWR